MATSLPLTPDSVRQAHKVVEQYVYKTPLLNSPSLDEVVSSPASDTFFPSPKLRIYLKCENMQNIGAFKSRGAHYSLVRLIDHLGLETVKKRGVVTQSSGNHGSGLALAARTFSLPCYVVMPVSASPTKIRAVESYGAKVILRGTGGPGLPSIGDEIKVAMQEIIHETGAIYVPPYDHEDVILGQGTCALELDEQYQESQGSATSKSALDMVLAPLGGGGLLGGICTYFCENARTRVFGCEPSFQGGDDGKRGLESNPPKRIISVQTTTIADGVRTSVGEIPWKIFTSGSDIKPKYLEGIRSVTEDQIRKAMLVLLERAKILAEPSACLPLAALLYDAEFRKWIAEQQGEDTWDVGVVLSGGNITLEDFVKLVNEAEVA